MSPQKPLLAALWSVIALATVAIGSASPASADGYWYRYGQPGWRDQQEWRERQAWREQQWREQQWREHEYRERLAREQPHGFPFVAPSRNNIPPPLYSPGPVYPR